MSRIHGIVERGRRAPEPAREARDLPQPAIDGRDLERKTYLTIRELIAYGGFCSAKAAYCWLARNRDRVPPHRRGRVLLLRRRDFDAAVASAAEREGATPLSLVHGGRR